MSEAEIDQPRYVFVAYKPDSDDYCQNCCMASYSSGFQFEDDLDEDSMLDYWAECLAYPRRCGEDGWKEIRVLRDGENVTWDPVLCAAAKERAEVLREARRATEAEKAAANRKKQELLEEQQARQWYEQLKSRFES